jgi:cellulose synthase (UDP-forming)
MTRSPLWREFESGDSLPLRILRFLILTGGVAFLGFSGILDLTWPQQTVLGLLTVLLCIWMDRSSNSYLVTLTLMLVSMYSTFRYAYWRISSTVKFFLDPATHWTALDFFFIALMVGAETYAFTILYLGYLQTLWPLRRTPVPLPEDPEDWPSVDLLIPTYNEPLSVVRFTALAAMNIDWPAEKLNVYILDDGRREEFRLFAEAAGIGYITRIDSKHAKAGNINHALERLDAPYVAIFDCDHVPTRSFLQVTMGWFLRDQKLAMLQTPHHFYSPDPFERNLHQFRTIPNEGELFYGVVQDGNDFWNATFFCGSCAVLRRTSLDEIGGVAVETVTEDAHTSLRMQMNGWNTAYINIPQAAGLATERLSAHVKQRIRWARGMVQIMRIDNPLFARGLTPAQRLCYFNAMTHFLYALPRLIFLTAPLIYLVFGHTNVPGYWATILAYAAPHLVMSNITNSRIQGQHRHSFWNEIYETVLAPYIFLPTMIALINPRLGSFNVTAKGGVVNRSFFDQRIAQPFLWMLGFDLLGLLLAIPRSILIDLPLLRGLYDGSHPGTIVMNVLWTLFNMTILGVATAVAWESQQRRQTVRVAMQVPTDVLFADGRMVPGVSVDLSSGGVMIRIEEEIVFPAGEMVSLIFPVLDGDAVLPATVVSLGDRVLRAQFDPLSMQEEEALTMVLYSRADTWLGWGESREADRPIFGMLRILRLSFQGLKQTVRGLLKRDKSGPRGRFATIVAPLFFFTLGSAILSSLAMAQPGSPMRTPRRATPSVDSAPASKIAPQGQFDNTFTLADVSVPDPIVLTGINTHHSIYFHVSQRQMVKSAALRLRYHFSPGLIPALSQLKVSLNGILLATLPVTAQPMAAGPDLSPHAQPNPAPGDNTTALETTLTLPTDTIVQNNELSFEFIGHYTMQCEDPTHSALWAQVDSSSVIDLSGSLLPLPNDLKLLPLPFYDAGIHLHPVLPIVFLKQPSAQAMRAAAIVSSWFGILADYRPVRFPVSIETIPAGNAIVITEGAVDLPASLSLPSASAHGPTLAMRANPGDPNGKLLILTGDTVDDTVLAAQALTLQRALLESDTMSIPHLRLPLPRRPDDAPRWLSTERATPFGDIPQTGQLQSDGSAPIGVYMRLPPDLYLRPLTNIALHLGYRYNGIPLSNDSSLQVAMNSAYVSSTPTPHTDKASARLETTIPIPTGNLRPFSNSLMMQFVFQLAKKGRCQEIAPQNLEGAILKDSYLDLSGIPHSAALPDLELFANAGYPYTRLADLTNTSVVLPDQPTPEELEMFLTLMGHFGAQTGYPVLNVSVTNADGMRADSGKDYIVMGSVDDQPALRKLSDALPVTIEDNGLHIQDTQGFFAPLQHAWWRVRGADRVESGQLETQGGLPDALLEGIEWPRSSGHSLVVIALRDASVVPGFLKVFLKTSQSSDISQSVSVLQGERFVSFRIGNDFYRVGSLGPWIQINLLFAEYPWLAVIVTLIFCVLMAVLIRAMLRRHARTRLQGTASSSPNW